MIKYPDKSDLRERKFIFIHSSEATVPRSGGVLTGAWGSGNMAYTAKKQRVMNAAGQIAFSISFHARTPA